MKFETAYPKSITLYYHNLAVFMRLIPYIQFYLRSTNSHGVHSPFVYQLLTQCFYAKAKKERTKNHPIQDKKQNLGKELPEKYRSLIWRSLTYLDVTSLFISPLLPKSLIQYFSKNQNLISPKDFKEVAFCDAILAHAQHEDAESMQKYYNKSANHSVLIIIGIHENKKTNILWEELKANLKVRVTIDLYWIGFVFFRAEQAKEHFVIRV